MEPIDELVIELLKDKKIDEETAVKIIKAIYKDSKEVQPQQTPYIPTSPIDLPLTPVKPCWPWEYPWTAPSSPQCPIITYGWTCNGQCKDCNKHCNRESTIINE